MKVLPGAWWGVLAALLVVPSCQPRPSPDSDSESWRPVFSGHRVNRYRSSPDSLDPGKSASRPYFKSRQLETIRIRNCLKELKTKKLEGLDKRVLCFKSTSLELLRRKYALQRSVDREILKLIPTEKVSDTWQADAVDDNNGLQQGANNNSAYGYKSPLRVFRNQQSLHGPNKKLLADEGSSLKTRSARQRRRRRSTRSSRRTKLRPAVVKMQQPADKPELKWVPVSLAPPKKEEDLDTKTNSITNDLVHSFVSNSLPDLNFPQESAGTLVQVVTPLLSQSPEHTKWESVSLDDLILSHTTEPTHHHKPSTWHKRPTVILIKDTPQELLPKPPNFQNHYHEDPFPEPQSPSPSPEPFPRPTYHYPRPSPEPPPKPTFHYPSAEPAPEPVYHYKPSTHRPTSHPIYHYPTPEPHFPYTSVIIHTSTSIHPDLEPEPSPEPQWTFQSHYPEPEAEPEPEPEPEPDPEPEPEDPDPEPEIIVGNDPFPEPYDDPTVYADQPNKPSPPPIYIIATPISAAKPPSPLNPATVSSGKPPPSIVILSSPEDTPVASLTLADPAYPSGAGGGGGGLIPIIPPIVPGIVGGGPGGLLGVLGGAGQPGGGGTSSDCPSVQLFNVQTITNSLENKDCVINLNSPIHNVNGNGQIEAPNVQADGSYDDIPDSSTVATTTKKPSSGSMSILEYIGSFFASLTIFNPISLSFFSFLFAPVSILLASGLGVAALVLPWAVPSYWFGRRVDTVNRRGDYFKGPYRFRESVLRFERNLKSGMDFDSFLDNIGLL